MTDSSSGGRGFHAGMALPTLLFAAILAAAPITARAQDDFSTLASRLIEMRGEVDTLRSELNVEREEHKSRMAYLTAQPSRRPWRSGAGPPAPFP